MTDKEKSLYPFPQRESSNHSFTVLRSWWQGLELDKGDRANLRRAASLTAVMLNPAFHRLLRELRQAGYGVPDSRYPKLAAIAGLAARVDPQKEDPSESLATRMGTPKSTGGKAVVSELRMRRLLACDDLEELYTLLRRALALLDNHASLADLATTIWHWVPMDEKRTNDPRRQLAYDYYAAAPL